MVKTTTKAKPGSKISRAKSTKSTVARKKSTAKKITPKTESRKVDYYPNRVPFYTAVAAVMILLLLAVMVSI